MTPPLLAVQVLVSVQWRGGVLPQVQGQHTWGPGLAGAASAGSIQDVLLPPALCCDRDAVNTQLEVSLSPMHARHCTSLRLSRPKKQMPAQHQFRGCMGPCSQVRQTSATLGPCLGGVIVLASLSEAWPSRCWRPAMQCRRERSPPACGSPLGGLWTSSAGANPSTDPSSSTAGGRTPPPYRASPSIAPRQTRTSGARSRASTGRAARRASRAQSCKFVLPPLQSPWGEVTRCLLPEPLAPAFSFLQTSAPCREARGLAPTCSSLTLLASLSAFAEEVEAPPAGGAPFGPQWYSASFSSTELQPAARTPLPAAQLRSRSCLIRPCVVQHFFQQQQRQQALPFSSRCNIPNK